MSTLNYFLGPTYPASLRFREIFIQLRVMTLTLELKTLEHHDHVIGAGEGVTLTNFHRQPRRHRSAMTKYEMTAYMNAQFQNMRQSIREEFREHVQ